MRLTGIRLENFMGYVDTSLDLEAIDSLVVVGENGSGKSAILDAVSWALYDRSRIPSGGEGSSPNKLVHEGATRARVTVSFRSAGRAVTVVREHDLSTGGTLQVLVDGERQTQHTTRETFAEIARLVGMGYGPLLAGPIMVQAGQYTVPTGLMQVGPSERKTILMEALANASIYAPLHERAKAGLAERDSVARTAEVRITELEVEAGKAQDLAPRIAEAEEALRAAEQAAEEADREWTTQREALAAMTARAEHVASLQKQIGQMTLSLAENNRQLQTAEERKANATSYLATHPEPEPDAHTEAARKALRERVRAAQAAREDAAAIRTRRDRLQADLNALEAAAAKRDTMLAQVPCHGDGIYAACPLLVRAQGTPEQIARIRDERDVLTGQLGDIAEIIADGEAATNDLDELEVAARKVESVRANRERAAEALTQSTGDIARLGEVITRDAVNLADFREQLAAIDVGDRGAQERWVARLAINAATAKEAVVAARNPLSQLQRQQAFIDRAKDELAKWRERSAEARGEAETYRILSAAFHRDGIPSLIIETAIPLIEGHANEVLGRLPGGLEITMSVGDGGSDRLNVLVHNDGIEQDYYMLSIGQRFRVDLALRIALARLLAAQSGVAAETLWLDEPLAHVDARGRAAVIEALGAVEEDFGLIVVVSHHDEFNDAFGHRLTVERTDGISTAVLS